MFKLQTMERIRVRLLERLPLLEEAGAQLERAAGILPQRESWALRFLFAYAPLCDLIEYPVDLFLDYARHGVFLYETVPACREMDEGLFLDNVLFHRVNNEELVPCRRFFHHQLAERVAGKSGVEAALAVNYWCCEEACYQTTDERTVSPMAVFRSARGRCGEESTFAVHALRSVGIPARQVYVPRWAHCDDNHAWVEVYCDGKWQFLGACEPEEALNRGWFVGAASRAMMVQSRFFGAHAQGEENIGPFGCAALLNQLPRYADTKWLRVQVSDSRGAPIPGARVDFELLNYAQLTPIATVYTGEDGAAALNTGKGSLHLHVVHGGRSVGAVSGPDDINCTVVLDEASAVDGQWRELIFLPPAEQLGREAPLTSAQKRTGKDKLSAANAKREQKVAAFAEETLLEELASPSENPAAFGELLRKSCGNLPQLQQFLQDSATQGEFFRKEAMLRALPPKDLADCTADVLLAALTAMGQYEKDYSPKIFAAYLLNPRIAIERLTAYHEPLQRLLSGEQQAAFRQSPATIWQYIQAHVREEPAQDYPTLITTPVACITSGIGSELSQKVLFVAICRTLGIPARIEKQTGGLEYYSGGDFHAVAAGKECRAVLRLEEGETKWNYRRNWSLAKQTQERTYQTLLLEDTGWSWGELILPLAPGRYRIITANRLPSGEIRAKEITLALEDGEEKRISMELQPVAVADLVQRVSLDGLALPGELSGVGLRLWLAVGEEPTEHILNELLERGAEFAPLQSRMLLVLAQEDDLENATLQRVRQALPQTGVCIDSGRELGAPLARRMYLDPDTLPLILVNDGEGCGAYGVCGYNVSTADMLLKILGLLMEGER